MSKKNKKKRAGPFGAPIGNNGPAAATGPSGATVLSGTPAGPATGAAPVGLGGAPGLDSQALATADVDGLVMKADAVAASLSIEELSEEAPVAGAPAELVRKLERAHRQYQRAEEQCEERQNRLAERERELSAQRQAFEVERRGAVAQREELERKRVELIQERERIEVERIQAETGFADQRAAALEEWNTRVAELKSRHNELLDRIQADELARIQRAGEQERELRAHLADERGKFDAELAAERESLLKERSQLRQLRAESEAERANLKDLESRLDHLVAARARHPVDELQRELDRASSARDSLQARYDELRRVLDAREEADRRAGGRSKEALVEELGRLEHRYAELERRHANCPERRELDDLEALRRAESSWASTERDLQDSILELKSELAQRRMADWELEQLRTEKETLERTSEVLKQRVEQLKKVIDDHLHAAEGATPFKACSAMDVAPELQAAGKRFAKSKPLAKLAHYVRHRIARGEAPAHPPLYYSDSDVRAFLGGMAMSRLLLLQGISGTGKTSLPRAVAWALGGHAAVVPVQAGWRDRQDLLGYFNTFEGRYRETEFLQALYAASCPKHADAVFFVILDEMNLSRPEQYFADVLSALEADPQNPELVLTDIQVAQAPRHLIDGRKIRIPPNVWFVGTANHDETTVEFADKTYDRSQVLELPHRRDTFAPDGADRPMPQPLSVQELRDSFDEAVAAHERSIDDVQAFFEIVLADKLADLFDLGLSNRLYAQVARYVPVVAEAGGTKGEAADHLLAWRVLRKIRNRHALRLEDLQTFEKLLRAEWGQIENGGAPKQTLALLDTEMRRLRAAGRFMGSA